MEPIVGADHIGSLVDQMQRMAIKDEDIVAVNQSMGNHLPNEIVEKIFWEHVPPAAYIVLMQTCKAVCKVFSNPDLWRQIFDREGMCYFDEVKCRKYRGEPGEVPPISLPKAYGYFNSDCKLFPGKKVKETHKLQLFYKEIDGKPITLNYAGTLAKNPKVGIAACFDETSWPRGFEEHGETSIGEAFWAFVVVKTLASGHTWIEERLRLAAKHPQYCLHRAVERSIANFDNVVETGEYLDDPDSFTICKETGKDDFGQGEDDYHLTIGAPLVPYGLIVSYDDDYRYAGFGVALLRKFSESSEATGSWNIGSRKFCGSSEATGTWNIGSWNIGIWRWFGSIGG